MDLMRLTRWPAQAWRMSMHGGNCSDWEDRDITAVVDSKTSQHLGCLQTHRSSHHAAHDNIDSISTFPLANIYQLNTEPCGFSNMPAKLRWLVLQRGKGMKMRGSKLNHVHNPTHLQVPYW
jgi:hypothetical protein